MCSVKAYSIGRVRLPFTGRAQHITAAAQHSTSLPFLQTPVRHYPSPFPTLLLHSRPSSTFRRTPLSSPFPSGNSASNRHWNRSLPLRNRTETPISPALVIAPFGGGNVHAAKCADSVPGWFADSKNFEEGCWLVMFLILSVSLRGKVRSWEGDVP